MGNNKKIPKMKTDKEIAGFWDTHSLADYVDDTEETDVEFVKPRKRTISIRLDSDKIKQVKHIAQKTGLAYTSIVRSWVIEKLATLH
jgi:predicted DNA binding CopG/RHH family protein